MPLRPSAWLRGFLAGVVGAVIAAPVGFVLFFFVAAPVLFDPTLQSAKLLTVWETLEPLPLAVTNPPLFVAGLALVGGVQGLAFAGIRRGLPTPWLRRGLAFGLLLWAVQSLFFEYFAPLNLFGEPLFLVALELALWLPVQLTDGVIISAVYGKGPDGGGADG